MVMAQETGSGRTGRLARRFGVLGRVGVALAVVALLALGVVATVARGSLVGGVVVERAGSAGADGGEVAAPEGDADGGSGEGRGDVDSGAEQDAVAPDEGEGAALVVHVDGAVAAPGVYELPAASRVNDAVIAAGGLAEGADTTGLTLAAPLADGEKVHVPREGEDLAPAAGDAPAAGGGSEGSGAALININSADVAELDELPGVGEATARAIVEDRERNGPFSTPEDLMRVSGIGEKKFAKMEGMICV